jgi:flavodoxin I
MWLPRSCWNFKFTCMTKIGVFCGTNTHKTLSVAKKIMKAFDSPDVVLKSIEESWGNDFEAFDCIIAGAATWFDGELPVYWDEILPELRTLQLKGKKVAIFGLGDQVKYPDNFVDGIGLLADAFVASGADLVGLTSPEGYVFNHSQALKDGMFQGLALDIENESDKTSQRIQNWVNALRKEFEL